MKKAVVFFLTILLIVGLSVGYFGYYSEPEEEIERTEAYTPNFWDLSTEVQLLARTIYAEAKGEPYIGQVAVGAVIMNRVNDADFPNSLTGVIYQPWAFTPVARGQIWNETPNDSAIRASLAALRGWDPTYNSLYFYNPAKVESTWVFSRQTVRRIGKHVYAR